MKLVIYGGGARISYLLSIKKYIEKNNIHVPIAMKIINYFIQYVINQIKWNYF